MKNITLAVDDDVLARVRVLAAERNTTVNALVRQHMEQLARDADRLSRAKAELRELSQRSEVELGPDFRFSREDAYGDFPRHQRADLRGRRPQE